MRPQVPYRCHVHSHTHTRLSGFFCRLRIVEGALKNTMQCCLTPPSLATSHPPPSQQRSPFSASRRLAPSQPPSLDVVAPRQAVLRPPAVPLRPTRARQLHAPSASRSADRSAPAAERALGHRSSRRYKKQELPWRRLHFQLFGSSVLRWRLCEAGENPQGAPVAAWQRLLLRWWRWRERQKRRAPCCLVLSLARTDTPLPEHTGFVQTHCTAFHPSRRRTAVGATMRCSAASEHSSFRCTTSKTEIHRCAVLRLRCPSHRSRHSHRHTHDCDAVCSAPPRLFVFDVTPSFFCRASCPWTSVLLLLQLLVQGTQPSVQRRLLSRCTSPPTPSLFAVPSSADSSALPPLGRTSLLA